MAATSEIQKLERRHAENPDGRYFAPLADAYRKAGQVDEALILVRAGIEKHPDYLSAHIVLGRCLLDKKDDEGAGQAFERVLGLDTENIIALKSLSEIAERRGDPVGARQWIQKLLLVDPMNAEADADLQRLGGPIAEAPTAPVAATPADLGSEQPSEFSFADVTPAEHGADTLTEPAQGTDLDLMPQLSSGSLGEPALVADMQLMPLPSDVPDHTESIDPGIVSVQFQPPTEALPPSEMEVHPFDESLEWGTGERTSRSVSQQDIDAALREHDQSVVDGSQVLETVPSPAEGRGDGGDLVLEEPPQGGLPSAPAAGPVPEEAPTLPEPEADVAPEPSSLSDLPIIMPEDVTPAEEMARPSGKQRQSMVGPLLELPPAAEAAPSGPEPPPLVTETMGDLYLRQGFRAEAAEVFRSVLAQRPDDVRLREKLAALEAPPPALSARALGGESVRTWLRRLAAAHVSAPVPPGAAEVPAGPSPLEEALALPESPPEAVGEPTHLARDAFTLDAIFGGPPGSSPAPVREVAPPAPPATGATFDEFFGAPAEQASVRPDPAAPPEPPPADDDISSFNTWLRGLKR